MTWDMLVLSTAQMYSKETLTVPVTDPACSAYLGKALRNKEEN